jgi:hypothetical protein
VTLQWTGGQSARQIIQQAISLSGPWTPSHTNIAPTAITNSLTVSNLISAPRYFRIQIAP